MPSQLKRTIEIAGKKMVLKKMSLGVLDAVLEVLTSPGEDAGLKLAQVNILMGNTGFAVGRGILKLLAVPEFLALVRESMCDRPLDADIDPVDMLGAVAEWLDYSDFYGLVKKLVAAGDALIKDGTLMSALTSGSESTVPPSTSAGDSGEPTD